MSRKIQFLFGFLALQLLGLVLAQPSAFAQEQNGLELRLRRIMGYSSGSGRIQGTFEMSASGPEELSRVIFTIDGQPVGEVTAPPYKVRFSTSNYALGEHLLAAQAVTSSGETLASNEIRVVFTTAEESMQAGLRIALPIFGFTVLLMLASFGFSLLGSRKLAHLPPGAPRKYGFSGGAICPNCHRPFSLAPLSFNLGPGRKFDRCPFCGKWSLVKVQRGDVLRQAEAAELESDRLAQRTPGEDEAGRLHKDLEDSKYQDL